MIFLLGINHGKQLGQSKELEYVTQLKSSILSLLKKESINVIAEENSVQSQKINGATPAQEIAEENTIKYIFADPDIEERRNLGIRLREDTAHNLGIFTLDSLTENEANQINNAHRDADELREREWLKRVKEDSYENIIFICGFNHVETFKELLSQNGHEVFIYNLYK